MLRLNQTIKQSNAIWTRFHVAKVTAKDASSKRTFYGSSFSLNNKVMGRNQVVKQDTFFLNGSKNFTTEIIKRPLSNQIRISPATASILNNRYGLKSSVSLGSNLSIRQSSTSGQQKKGNDSDNWKNIGYAILIFLIPQPLTSFVKAAVDDVTANVDDVTFNLVQKID